MVEEYDAIVIGTGQAGPALAARCASAGWKTAIIERKLVGGTCVNVGCIPTKALVASARAAHVARRAADFGVEIDGEVRVDMKRVHARMKEISGQSNEGVTRWLEGLEGVDLIRGHARFTSATELEVDGGRRLSADRVFINVGGRAFVPDMPGVGGVPYLTNSSMMELDELPAHLVVVGGSYIGLEFAQMFRRFGSEVTVIERSPRLVAREDEDVSQAVLEILEAEGITVHTDADCIGFEPLGGGVRVRTHCEGEEHAAEGTHVLVAVGRVPNTGDLGLEAAGVEVNERGYITVDDQLRTSAPGIWALGDCNGRGAFTHTAYNDYEIAAGNLFDEDPRRLTDRIPCYALYIDPPLGRVGMSEAEVRASGRSVLVGKRPMTQVGRAKERSETQGFMKVFVDAETKEILGGTILGIGGDEVVQTFLPVMYAKGSYELISRAVHIHPTVAELLPTMLQGLRPL